MLRNSDMVRGFVHSVEYGAALDKIEPVEVEEEDILEGTLGYGLACPSIEINPSNTRV